MKVIHESVKYKLNNESELINLLNTKKEYFIASTTQFSAIINSLNTKEKGIVLGCNNLIIKKTKLEKILFLGDGVFHALMIKKNYPQKKLILLNPFNMKEKELTIEDVKKFIFREEIAKDNLKHAKNIGVLISTKKGQERVKKALELKKKFEKQGKKVYLFLFETINADEFMNFPKIDCLINTACPRIALDDYKKFDIPIINYELIL